MELVARDGFCFKVEFHCLHNTLEAEASVPAVLLDPYFLAVVFLHPSATAFPVRCISLVSSLVPGISHLPVTGDCVWIPQGGVTLPAGSPSAARIAPQG